MSICIGKQPRPTPSPEPNPKRLSQKLIDDLIQQCKKDWEEWNKQHNTTPNPPKKPRLTRQNSTLNSLRPLEFPVI